MLAQVSSRNTTPRGAAKIANRRKDALYKFSRQLVNQYGEIHVGDVSPMKLVKTTMAKSVLDAGWGQLSSLCLAFRLWYGGGFSSF
ncbi:hypothetical protein [Azotobacter chroococcum]|uniref:hypothetical protein n=1 Tax=Azotobacter chroococcum TaxID=353 RepID=UPI00068DAD04